MPPSALSEAYLYRDHSAVCVADAHPSSSYFSQGWWLAFVLARVLYWALHRPIKAAMMSEARFPRILVEQSVRPWRKARRGLTATERKT